MMFQKIQTQLMLGLLAFSVATGGASLYLWNRNSALKDELNLVETTLEKAKENLEKVSKQLAQEQIIREAAEDALSTLRDVPDVDYNTPLPDSVRNVLDGFHRRVRR